MIERPDFLTQTPEGSFGAALSLQLELTARRLAQRVDRHEPAFGLEVPEGPAVAGERALHMRADLVDRALRASNGNRAIRAHLSLVPRSRVVEHSAGRDQPKLDQSAERNARLPAFALGNLE